MEVNLAKIIIVYGPANKGKTTAIKDSMNHFGIFVDPKQSDVLLCAPVVAGGVGCYVGFASGGDNLGIVQNNINFFSSTFPASLTHMIFACRSYGAGYNALQAFAASLGVRPIMLSAPDPNLAAKIISNIP